MRTRVVDTIPEWRFQAAVVARLHKLEADGLPLASAGDMNRGKRNRREQLEAKVTGLTSGEPDIRVYMAGPLLLFLELKTPRGSRSAAQRARHARLEALGFEVLTIAAPTPDALADEAERIVRSRLP